MIGLDISKVATQYLEIELHFTETGIISHESESSKIAQTDIVPQIYGYQLGKEEKVAAVEELFNFKEEDMFFLSLFSLTGCPMKKYSVTKGKGLEFIYYTPRKEDLNALRALLQDKI